MSQTVALYARVLSEKQVQQATIESQIEAVKQSIIANGFNVEEDLVFIDNGVSGSILERPGLDALRDKAATGQIDKVFIHNPDRLARRHAHQLILIEEFKKLGVEICFANRSISSTPEDQLLLQIQGVISEFEREKIIERNRRGKLYKAKQGKVNVMSHAPYGYVYIRKTEHSDARYEIHPEESKVVRNVFQLFCSKQMSLKAIARELTRREISTREKSSCWNASVIWRMLKNSTYFGSAVYRKTMSCASGVHYRKTGLSAKSRLNGKKERPREEWIVIPVPAILEEETFKKAQDLLEENRKLCSRNNKKNFYLLSGLLQCKECGYSFYGTTMRNGKPGRVPIPNQHWSYYQCAGQDYWRMPDGKVRCHSGRRIRAEVLEQTVWEATKRLIQEPRVVFSEYTRRNSTDEENKTLFQSAIDKKNKESRHLQCEKERLLDLFQCGSVTKPEIETRLEKIRSRIQKTEQERQMLIRDQEEKHSQLRAIEQFEPFRKRIIERLEKLPNEEKKKVVRLLVKEVIVDRKEHQVTIRHTIPAEQLRLSCSRLYSNR